MGRPHGATICLIVLILNISSTLGSSLWTVNIDESPAPSAEDGPLFSAHASRDRSLLPAQICGIVGAYLGSVVILGGYLLTVGRRLRRAAQTAQSRPSVEMVKPAAFEASPVSPGSQRSWYSPRKLKKSSAPNSVKNGSNPGSPGIDSLASFDPNVIEADRIARQQQLEQLYAAALAQEATKSQTVVATETELLPHENARPAENRRLRLLTSAPHLNAGPNPASPTTPKTPKSPVRAIYPPDSPMPQYPSSPTSPIRAEYPQTPLTPRYPTSPMRRPPSPVAQANRASRTSSSGSHTSGNESHKRLRKSLRNLRISAPISRYAGETSDEDARTPLTPRYYPNPGAPPLPPSPSTRSDVPTTPGTHDGYAYSDSTHHEDHIDEIRALPRTAPQRPSSYQYHNLPQTDSERRGVPPHLDAAQQQMQNNIRLRTAASNGSASTIGSLPFRNQQLAVPLPSPGPATKVTYLERRRDVSGPLRTGMATPYSPYMPFTPITPVTPHLTSRMERKQREKELGRRVLSQEDQVVEEDEMWGSGY